MKRFCGFTLAEVLITLTIVGIVASIAIPSVISNSQQQEFKTGLRKAVSVLNSAITLNLAIEGETPYDNGNLYGFLQRHMSVTKSVQKLNEVFATKPSGNNKWSYNSAFYTNDGMRFEFRENGSGREGESSFPLYEDSSIHLCMRATNHTFWDSEDPAVGKYDRNVEICSGCGSLGLNSNTANTKKPPCLIMVDVNGDRKPNPSNINCKTHDKSEGAQIPDCAEPYKLADPLGIKLTDLFTIMITDKQALPYGIAAQKAMYNARKLN